MASSGGFFQLSHPPDYDTNNNRRCRNEAHECPYCMFEGLETPVVSESVKRLVSTNDPPDENNLPSLIASLNVVLSLSASVDKCIDTVQTVLDQMKNIKETYTLSIQQYRGAMHPIRSIPDDILRTIFHWHIISEYGSKISAEDSVSSNFSPWTLSRVSRSWRALVLSSPQLWSTFNIVTNNGIRSENHGLFLLSKQELALRRSAGCDLSIRLSYKRVLYHPSVMQDLDLVLPTMRRWRSLDILGNMSLLELLTTCSFDNLVELTIQWIFSYHITPGAPQAGSMFKNAWNLRRLTLRGQGSIDVPWERLTTFSTDIYGLSNLPKLTAIESLKLDLHADPTQEKNQWRAFQAKMPSSLSFPKLRCLKITGFSDRNPFYRYICQSLHFPSLTTLLIPYWSTEVPALSGNLPHLCHITLMSAAPPAEIDAFLARYPSITSLYLANPHVIQLWHSHSTLLPNLAILRMAAKTLTSDPVCVIEALESPCEKNVELRISGKEMAIEKTRDVISKINPGLLERWDAVYAKLKIVDADERDTGRDF